MSINSWTNSEPQKSFSWEIHGKSVAIKKSDKSFFDYRETGIPEDIRWFFAVEKLNIGEKKNINLLYKGVVYPAYIEVTKANRTRMVWGTAFYDKSIQELHKYAYYPLVMMRKVSQEVFSSYELDAIKAISGYEPDVETYLISFLSDSYEENQNEAEAMSFSDLAKKAKENSLKEKKCREVSTIEIIRDPYIAEYAKRRANGVCQLCGQPAPFVDKKGRPYLESHHLIWLSKGGEDTVENTAALCPNCHRKMHILADENDLNYLLEKNAGLTD